MNPPDPKPYSIDRRGLLAGAAGALAASGLAGALGPEAAAAPTDPTPEAPAAPAPPETPAPPQAAAPPEATAFGPVTVRPNDARYGALVRGNNFRFVGRPSEIRVLGSTEQVVRAVSDAVRTGRRIAVRSGGHCFEDFTADPAVRMLLDLSPMDAVGYDAGRGAFAVQPGATLGHVYRTLAKGWGVTIPAGGCPEVGAGGHFVGGGYGPLSRRYGSVVDHLYGVEVVVVGRDGTARAVVATREEGDPHRDLWWAHTGAGGGNFGVVTRYWLRSPDAVGHDPSHVLPPAPRDMLEYLVVWAWNHRMTAHVFTSLLRNFGRWHERWSAPDSPYAGLYAIMLPRHRKAASFEMIVQIDADIPNAAAMVADFVTAVRGDTDVEPIVNQGLTMPWMHLTTWPGLGEPGDVFTRRYKLKAGYLRRSLTDTQLDTVHRYLTDDTGTEHGGMLLIGYGGRVGAVAPDATAIAQRGAIMKAVYQTLWLSEDDDADNLAWVRAFYRDVYADTGGAPVPGEVSDGTYINYPDNDLADPARNTSGVPWYTLYYGANYPRLQRVKAKWDPRDVFRHTLSIRPPS
ncbi:FAD-binding oxidoreductase [Embleya sp. MST-111070]|uniref:FAD-binding oxidoreductase n=1 Tax=Embleya sp. MST-111070 TaxID=3398231 RepID=UPI003F73FD60